MATRSTSPRQRRKPAAETDEPAGDAGSGRAPSPREAAPLPPPLLRPAEVAEILSVTVSQVYTLMRDGDLPALKIGRKGVWRVSREMLEEYLAGLTEEARQRRRSAVTAQPPD